MSKYLVMMSSLFLALSCGSSNDDELTTSSAFNEAYEQLVESAPDYSSNTSYVLKKTAGQMSTLTNWDNTSTAFWNIGGTTNLNPKDYVGYMLGESNDQSIFNRARMPFLISCCLDVLAEKSGNLFTAGTQTFEFTDAVVGVCGDDSEFNGLMGEEITIEVSNLTETSNYDQKIYFDSSLNPMFGHDQWMYVRNNDTTLNFMHIEGTAGSDFFASSISFNKSTEGGFFQYIDKNNNQQNVFRIFMDPTENIARIFAHSTIVSNSATNTFVITSTFDDQIQAAISISWSNIQAPYDTDLTDGNACLNATTGLIADDNTLTCTTINRTTLASSGASSIISDLASLNTNTVFTNANNGSLSDNLPTFDESTILSASFGL